MLNVGGEEVKGGDSYSTLKPSLVFSFACAKIDFLNTGNGTGRCRSLMELTSL